MTWPPEPGADQVDLVDGPSAEAALRGAAQQLDGELVAWTVRTVDHRPGRGATAVHDVRLRRRGGGLVDHVLVLTTDVDAVAGAGDAGTVVRSGDGTRLGAWPLPHDPSLPGLAPAMDPAAVADLLHRCGVAVRPEDVTVRLRAYRPRRRAVVRVSTVGLELFLKVVAPEHAEALHSRHRDLARAGVPAARSLGADRQGVVVLEQVRGQTWRQTMREHLPVPSARSLWSAMDRLPRSLLTAPPRLSWAEQSWHHESLLRAALPGAAGAVRTITDGADVADDVAALPTVPVHGDLYEAQVMVDRGRLSGVLDLDTAGPGHRIDDEACVLAHLALLPLALPETVDGCAAALHEHLEASRSDPELLWRRMSLVLLTLATGPARHRRPGWRRRTEAWLALPLAAVRVAGQRPWRLGPQLLPRLLSEAGGLAPAH